METKNNISINIASNVEIEIMGLFDNVEALAAPDYKEKFCNPNQNHLNQFVNIKRVLHAVSLDDNRAQIFTPILTTCHNIELKENRILNDVVEEVWFSGAHSDVGGGYSKEYDIANVSLNWMINEVKKHDLFHTIPVLDMHTYGKIHDSEASFFTKLIYKRQNRNIPLYLSENGKHYNDGKLKIHKSVIQRLEKGLQPFFKFSKKYKKDWFDQKPFKKCFDSIGDKRIYIKEKCDVIEIIPKPKAK